MHPRFGPERLSRVEWLYQQTPIYFVTACSRNRQPIFGNAEVHDALRAFGEAGPQHGAWLGAYVLMPDHLHAFVAVDHQRMALSAWMKSLKNSLSRVLRRGGIAAPHWQKGFFDHILRSDESYAQKWEYVRENPVRAGLVQRWEEWPYVGELCRVEFAPDL